MSGPDAMLHLQESEFDKAITRLDDKCLLDLVILLQGEMASEQERFEDLTHQLALIPDQDSEEYTDVSADLMESQARLAELMGRNMKCFTQQAANRSRELQEDGDEDDFLSRPLINGRRSPKLTNGDHRGLSSDEEDKVTKVGHSKHSKNYDKIGRHTNGNNHMGDMNGDDYESTKSSSSKSSNGFSLSFNGASGDCDKTYKSNEDKMSAGESSTEVITVNRVVSETTFKVRTSKHPSGSGSSMKSYNGPADQHKESDKLQFEEVDREKLESNAISEIEDMMRTLNTESSTDVVEPREGDADNDDSDNSPREGDADEFSSGSYSRFSHKIQSKAFDIPGRKAAHDSPINGSDNENEPREGEPDICSFEASTSMEDISKRKDSLTLKLSGSSTSSSLKSPNTPPGVKKRVSFIVADIDTGETSTDPIANEAPSSIHEYKSQLRLAGIATGQPAVAHDGDREASGYPQPSEVEVTSGVTDDICVEELNRLEEVPPALQIERQKEVAPTSQAMGCVSTKYTHKLVQGAPPVTESTVDGITGDEKIQDRVTLKQWDPVQLLKELYEIRLEHDEDPLPHKYLEMEGFLEKLPINKRKATLLKTWKRRYFKTKEGNLHYYELDETGEKPINRNCESSSGFMQLSGGSVEDLGGRMIGLDDGRGRYLVVRAASDQDFTNWMRVFHNQVIENAKATYIRPLLHSLPHRQKKVVIIDIGSCSVRAGVLGESPTLPTLFFPSLTAKHKETHRHTYGFDALKPDIRSCSLLSFAVRPSIKVDQCAIDLSVMPGLFEKIFTDLEVDPSEHWVMFSTPGNFSDNIKEQFMNMLINNFLVKGANIMNQSLLALYSYNATSGIVVDVGERLEIVPVTDGYIAEAGVTRQPYGGHRVTEALNSSFTESRYRFFTDVEFQIVRLAMEKTCFVSTNYNEDLKRCTHECPEEYRASLDLTGYDLPKGTWTHVAHDLSRFKSPEGLFNMDIWEMDNPSLQKLVQKAVQACPMDMRREMWRCRWSIACRRCSNYIFILDLTPGINGLSKNNCKTRSVFLSSGLTRMPGFAERLQKELQRLAPPSITCKVHASPQRYHSAYIGACVLANMQQFETACISSKEWLSQGPKSLRKWHMF